MFQNTTLINSQNDLFVLGGIVRPLWGRRFVAYKKLQTLGLLWSPTIIEKHEIILCCKIIQT